VATSSHPDTRGRVSALWAATALLALAIAIACGVAGYRRDAIVEPPPEPEDRPIEVTAEGYATSDSCRSCHPQMYDTWYSSYHRTMTQVVGPDTVIADFDDVEVEFYGRRFLLQRRGDEYWVEIEDPDWKGKGKRKRVWKQLLLSTGSHHFQSFWYSDENLRKMNFLGICWRIDEERWIPVHASFLIPPDAEFPLKGRWNTGCHMCHTTRAEPRLLGKGKMDTVASEFGITCESCHGPGEEHVLANRNPLRRYELHASGEDDPTIVNPEKLPAGRSSEVCAQCHALTNLRSAEMRDRWRDEGFHYVPGEPLAIERAMVFEGDDYFWPDGMVRLAGREFNALLHSPCFAEATEETAMSCFSCHRMHQLPDDPRPRDEWRADQLKVGMRTDQGCTQCHDEYATPEAAAEHAHHPIGVGGAEGAGALEMTCYDCHMPHTSWSLLGAIRSHEVSNPSVQETVDFGRPNACNLCHLDRTLAWTSKHLHEWWDVPRPHLTEEERGVATGVHWALSGDAGERGLVAWHMGWGPAQAAARQVSDSLDWMVPYLGLLLEDPYEAVRFTAGRALPGLPGYDELAYDFMGPPEDRRDARERVLERWRREGGKSAEPSLLMLGDARIDRAAFAKLLAERDNRPVTLSE
jgi:hypothetical protein